MFGPTIQGFIYQLNVDQQKRMIALLKEFDKEGIKGDEFDNKYKIENIIESIESTIKYDAELQVKKDAAAKGETTLSIDKWGVHETHCCLDHGCKYGEVDCPVVLKLTKQVYPCESCHD